MGISELLFLSFGGMEICHLAEWKSVIWRNRNRNYLVFSKYLCTFVKVF